MRDITLILAYYENFEMLRTQLDYIGASREKVRDHLNLIVIDDGSPTAPAAGAFYNPGVKDARLYRMLVNIPWNQDACRNLGMSEAQTEWCVLTDMDHLVPDTTLDGIMNMKVRDDCAYQFSRLSAPAMEPYKRHPNSWFISKTHYDKAGGYNEQYAGIYGTDGNFVRSIKAHGTVVPMTLPIIRVPREVIPDASTTTLERRSEWSDKLKESMKSSKLPWARGIFPWKRLR